MTAHIIIGNDFELSWLERYTISRQFQSSQEPKPYALLAHERITFIHTTSIFDISHAFFMDGNITTPIQPYLFGRHDRWLAQKTPIQN